MRHIEWHPNAELLQLVSSDDSRKIQVFDYIANKVINQIDGGHTFVLAEGGKTIVSIFNQEIRVHDYKTMRLKHRFATEEYLEAIFVSGENVLFGGEESDLMLWKIGDDRIRSIERGTERGVMKILGWQKENKCIVVSAEQNLTTVCTKTLQS